MPKLRKTRRKQQPLKMRQNDIQAKVETDGSHRFDSQCPACIHPHSSVIARWGLAEHRRCDQCGLEYLVNLQEEAEPKSGRIWQL